MSLRTLLTALPLFALCTTPALAEEDWTCRNGLFANDPPFALATVADGPRVFFHDDANGCPWTAGACDTDAYVIAGDTVILSKIRKGFACAFYPSRGGGTAGWLPTRQLRLEFVENRPPLSAWTGTWSSEGNPEITLSARFGQLHAKGETFWPGRPGEVEWPSVHVGQIEGPVSIAGHRGTYRDDNLCEVRFTLLRDYLVAGDNRQCGGANVSFSGVYRRTAK